MYSNSFSRMGKQMDRSSCIEPQRRSISAILGPGTSNRVFSSRTKAPICVPQARGIDMFNSSSARPTFSSTSPLSSSPLSSSPPKPNSNSPFVQISSSNDLYDLTDSRRDSSLRFENKKKNDYSPTKSRFSTHGHEISEINDILDKINSIKYEFKAIKYNSEDSTPENADDIETIVAFVGQPNIAQTFDSKTIEKLLSIARKNILRSISDIPKSLLYGDFYAPISMPNWNVLFFFHKLTSLIIINIDDRIIDKWIDNDFIIGLINLLNSPDPNEQTSTVILIQQIFEAFENKKDFIFNKMIKLVMSHNEGINSFVCVPPALKFFTYFFSQLKGYFNPSFYNFFKLVIFQLFTTDFVHNYYTILSSLCQIFYQHDSSITIWALNFLLNHWPLSNSTKHTIYLHHVRILANSLQSSSTEKIVVRLFEQIGRSVQSQNFKVANAALQVIGNVNFLFNFAPIFNTIIPPLSKSVKTLESHWHPEVRELMKNVLQVIEPIEENLKNDNQTLAYNNQFNRANRRDRRITQVLSDQTGCSAKNSTSMSKMDSPNSILNNSIRQCGSSNTYLPLLEDGSNANQDKTMVTRGNWMAIYQTAISLDTGLVTDVTPEKILHID